jgi:fructokinase
MNPIVGIGELLWDVYPDGRKVAGGAPFNFAFHCHQLGHPAVIVSRVGDDDLGRELREEVRRLGLSDEYIQSHRDHPTGTVRVTLDENKVPRYAITENVAWDYIAWDERLEMLAREAAVSCFGTLAQRQPTSRRTIHAFLATATGAIKVFDVNLRGKLSNETRSLVFDLSRTVDWLKVNDHELGELLSASNICGHLPRKESSLRWLFSPREPRQVGIVTRGEKSTAVSDRQRTEWIPAVPVDAVDTVGAGDAFTAAMVCVHLEGRSLRDCARFANHYAARVCEHQGATPRIDRAEIERAAFGPSPPG